MLKAWNDRAWEEYVEWQEEDSKIVKRINALLKDIERNGCLKGIGKPEALKYDLRGWYSRRIDDSNRLVYRIENGFLEIYQCKGHYN